LGRFAAPAFEGGVRCPLASSEARELLVGSVLAGAMTGSGSAGARESLGESSTVDSGRHLKGMISEQCSQHEVKRTGVNSREDLDSISANTSNDGAPIMLPKRSDLAEAPAIPIRVGEADRLSAKAPVGITSAPRSEPARYTGLIGSPRGGAKTRGEEP
jgi:hypothetical protein